MDLQPSTSMHPHNDLSPHMVELLDFHFRNHDDLSTVSDLAAELKKKCADLDSNSRNLNKRLTSLLASWTCRSYGAKISIHQLNCELQKLSLSTSQYGTETVGSRKIQKLLGEELPKLAIELRRFNIVGKYAETALQLEALIGDLEDAVLCVMNQKTANMLSTRLSDPCIPNGFGLKQENFLCAVDSLNDIENILLSVSKFQPQWNHLLLAVDTRVDNALAILRPRVIANYRAVLSSLGWPPKLLAPKTENGQLTSFSDPLFVMQGKKKDSYSQSFLSLCTLQHLQTRREQRQLSLLGKNKETHLSLWAIDELVSPIASQTEFHFSKWSDQPEFMFALVYKITQDFIVGIEDILQPLIDRARLVSYSAKEAWVSAMILLISGFLAKRVFPSLADKYNEKTIKLEAMSSWLHLIDLIIAFDKRMQSLVTSESGFFLVESLRFEGFSKFWSVLLIFSDRPDWLKIWSKTELKDAVRKLREEVRSENSWLINKKQGIGIGSHKDSEQYVLSTTEDGKSPIIADFSLKIAWKMIERCENLPSTVLRVQFIRSTAGRFLRYFSDILVLRFNNSEVDPDDDEALMRLCGCINAASYCVSKLEDWSDEANFIEMKISESKSKKNVTEDAHNYSCFFWEEINNFAELETNWVMEVISVLLQQFETLSWDYLQNKELFQETRISGSMDVHVSGDIVEALDSLRSRLDVIKLGINPKDFLDLWRSVADGLDHFIFRSIFMNDVKFCDKGVEQFDADMRSLFLIFQPYCLRPEAFFPCIRDSLELLKMVKEERKHLLGLLSKNERRANCLRLYGILRVSDVEAETILRNRGFTV